MIEELKNKRNLSYLINNWDDVNLPYMLNYNDVEHQIISFFKYGSELIYPAKSYFVAIIYAKCMEKYFGINFIEALNDKELLPDDKYFQPYDNDKELYDYVLNNVKNIWKYKSINKTVDYFKKEFLIDGTNH